jgi:hypothetical protein
MNFYVLVVLDDCDNPIKIWVCNVCNRKFENETHLVQHVKHECGVVGFFGCNFCNQLFDSLFPLYEHVESMHGIIFTDE